jgi:type IV pilus assembly protein PilA
MQNMLANLRARREDDERGFTLIELMVVVLIIAILIAIAIPTFLGAKSRAQDKAAQSSLRNALTNAKGIYTDQDSYGTQASIQSGLTAAEPSLQFVAVSTSPKQVSVAATGDFWIVMTAESKSGKCFAIADAINGPGTVFANLGKSPTGGCTATSATVPAQPADAAAVGSGSAPSDTVSTQWYSSW